MIYTIKYDITNFIKMQENTSLALKSTHNTSSFVRGRPSRHPGMMEVYC